MSISNCKSHENRASISADLCSLSTKVGCVINVYSVPLVKKIEIIDLCPQKKRPESKVASLYIEAEKMRNNKMPFFDHF